ncbi:MAG: hypothetical protein LC768_07290 [Acidobacteria bacterium]|nr:hypothetical protein [Acidobacteriota bacterium]
MPISGWLFLRAQQTPISPCASRAAKGHQTKRRRRARPLLFVHRRFSDSLSRFSKSRIARAISPNLRNAAIERSHSRLSNAGMPEMILPFSTS